jgi:hypothetical protein
LNVCRADRHSKQHLWSQCQTVSLKHHLTAHRLRWLGHVLRMGEERYPYQAVFSLMHDAGAAPRGAPPMSWEQCVTRDLQAVGQLTNMHVCVAWPLAEHVVESDTSPCCGGALPAATQCHT